MFQYVEVNDTLEQYDSQPVVNKQQIQDFHIKDDNAYFVLSEGSVSICMCYVIGDRPVHFWEI